MSATVPLTGAKSSKETASPSPSTATEASAPPPTTLTPAVNRPPPSPSSDPTSTRDSGSEIEHVTFCFLVYLTFVGPRFYLTRDGGIIPRIICDEPGGRILRPFVGLDGWDWNSVLAWILPDDEFQEIIDHINEKLGKEATSAGLEIESFIAKVGQEEYMVDDVDSFGEMLVEVYSEWQKNGQGHVENPVKIMAKITDAKKAWAEEGEPHPKRDMPRKMGKAAKK